MGPSFDERAETWDERDHGTVAPLLVVGHVLHASGTGT